MASSLFLCLLEDKEAGADILSSSCDPSSELIFSVSLLPGVLSMLLLSAVVEFLLRFNYSSISPSCKIWKLLRLYDGPSSSSLLTCDPLRIDFISSKCPEKADPLLTSSSSFTWLSRASSPDDSLINAFTFLVFSYGLASSELSVSTISFDIVNLDSPLSADRLRLVSLDKCTISSSFS